MPRWLHGAALILVSMAFIASALLFARGLGIEADEAMIANGIYDHGAPWYSWKFGAYEVPVMLISYLGALKTWFLNPYFAVWRPGPVSLRVPAILAGVATLWLFFAVLDRVAGRAAAWIGTLLLATDSCFLLVETTDFGFVALQFVFKLAAILLLLRFDRKGEAWALACAFFLFGLALWDKAVFGWVLAGLAAGALMLLPRYAFRHCNWRNVAIATVCFVLGALPLLIYNFARPLETLRANASVAREPVLAKADILLRTIDGSALFGFMTSAGVGGGVRSNLILPALAISALYAVVTWRRKAARRMLFALVVCLVTWLFMASTSGAGAAVQHTILLWPFHLMVIAIALAELPARWSAALTAVLCLLNLAVTRQYYADLRHNGPAIRWTDAIGPLEHYLEQSKSERILMADWGIIETLNLLSEGRLPVYYEKDPAPDVDTVFVSHTPEFTFLPEIRSRLEQRARADGFKEQRVAAIVDSKQRPTFEIFEFRKSSVTR
ncbi:MAG: glycosyltransferase family 39 protein [Bryobacterales bacterium]|nr:glycosyltransferase family 39 protein [Bryobacterales bacterium]MBV9401626.1 glycosyltransferase family 39 protein [Bryobacterales bacterium]